MKKWKDIPDWMAGNDHKLKGLILAVNSRMNELFSGEDEPKFGLFVEAIDRSCEYAYRKDPERDHRLDQITWRDLHDLIAGLRSGDSEEPKPEPAPEDPPDYSCPICGESAYVAVDDYVEPGPCKSHEDHKMLAAANRRIAQLTRERDEARVNAEELRPYLREDRRQRDEARTQALQELDKLSEQTPKDTQEETP